MDTNGLKNKNELIIDIENAINLCDNLEDPQKNISKTILEALMFIVNQEKIATSEFKSEKVLENKIPSPILKLSQELKINAEDIEDAFEFDMDKKKIELTMGFDGETWIQQQFKSTLCLLTAYSISYDIKEISSKDLVEQLESLGIESLPNLSPNLQKKQFNKYINVSGGANAQKIYKIKNFGIKHGKELIKELISIEM